MSPVSVKVSGVWKDAASVHTKVSGSWKTAADMPVNVGGVWKTGILSKAAFESIATINPSGTNVIVFSSIPQNYQHLQIRYIISDCSTAPGNVWYYPNGDSTGNKTLHEITGTGFGITAGGVTGLPWNRIGYQGFANSFPMVGIADIHDYSSTTKNKTTRVFWGNDLNSTNAYIALTSGYIPITSSFTSITIGRDSGTFPTGSHFALYGIKGA